MTPIALKADMLYFINLQCCIKISVESKEITLTVLTDHLQCGVERILQYFINLISIYNISIVLVITVCHNFGTEKKTQNPLKQKKKIQRTDVKMCQGTIKTQP